jgi:lipid-binding SYLF domain-containing protein
MSTHIRFVMTVLALTTTLILSMRPAAAAADSPPGVDSDVQAALAFLYKNTPAAKTLGATAKGILVFPNIIRAGFIVGAQYGEGELLKDGQIAGYYNIAAASYGLQIGAQGFAYVMFFMTDAALDYLDKSEGFEVGVGPTVVAVDAGMAKTMTTTTGRDDVYAFIFRQRGLMAGIGLQGSKITRMGR